MKIVFTGFRDKDLKERLELAGHKVTGKTSSKTNVVIAADPTGSSSSIKLAKEKGIHLGRPKYKLPTEFEYIAKKYLSKEITNKNLRIKLPHTKIIVIKYTLKN